MAKTRTETVTLILPTDTVRWLERYTRDTHRPVTPATMGYALNGILTPTIAKFRKKWRAKIQAAKAAKRAAETAVTSE